MKRRKLLLPILFLGSALALFSCYSLSDALIVTSSHDGFVVKMSPADTIGLERSPHWFRPYRMKTLRGGVLDLGIHFKMDVYGDFIFLRKMLTVLPPFDTVKLVVKNENFAPEIAIAVVLTELDGSEYEPQMWWERREFRLSFTGVKTLTFPLEDYVLAGYSSDEDGFLNAFEVGEVSLKLDDLPDDTDRDVRLQILGIHFEGGDRK